MNATTLSQSLNRDYDNAFKILETDFILGKGLGGFSTNGARAYPHNLFLELFCELGMVGTLLIVMIVFVPLVVKTRSISFIDYIQLLCSSFNSSHIY